MRIDLDVVLVNHKPYTKPFRTLDLASTPNDIAIIHLQGPLVKGAAVSFFLDQVRLLITKGVSNIVIDLLEAERIDDRGVGGLAAAYNSIRDVRGRIKYVINSNELLSVIGKNHLDHVFEIYQDGASALSSF